MASARSDFRLAGPAGASVALHLGLIAVILIGLRKEDMGPLPPVYRVNIVAAPPGPRAIGEVRTEPRVTPPAPVPPPPAPARPAEAAIPTPRPAPQRTPARRTPVEAPAQSQQQAANLPQAGGGPTGGRGTDVATVQTEGIDFPFPGYLNNIVRQIALRFSPLDAGSSLRAEVRFIIRRDGSVVGFGFVKRSGSYSFDLEAQGAVEAAARFFGPLPEGFNDDALPVVFSFDPRFIR